MSEKVVEIAVSPSKSEAQRYLLAAALVAKQSVISDIGNSQDVKNVLQILKQSGLNISTKNNSVLITGKTNGTVLPKIFSVGESGLAARLLLPLATLNNKETKILAEGTLKNRSIADFITIFKQLHCHLTLYRNNTLPAIIIGKPLLPDVIKLTDQSSSQYISGLLYLCFALNKPCKIQFDHMPSFGYLQLTIKTLEQFNAHFKTEKYAINYLSAVKKGANLRVGGDWSGSAFFIVLALKFGAKLTNLNKNSDQPDKTILKVLNQLHCKYDFTAEYTLCIDGNQTISAFNFDATNCPDLFPPLVCLASLADSKCTFVGAKRLHNKESNRGETLKKEMAKLGLKIILKDVDTMEVYPKKLHTGKINSCNDHRIAMAASTLSALHNIDVEIDNAEAIKKSYPAFYDEVGKFKSITPK